MCSIAQVQLESEHTSIPTTANPVLRWIVRLCERVCVFFPTLARFKTVVRFVDVCRLQSADTSNRKRHNVVAAVIVERAKKLIGTHLHVRAAADDVHCVKKRQFGTLVPLPAVQNVQHTHHSHTQYPLTALLRTKGSRKKSSSVFLSEHELG